MFNYIKYLLLVFLLSLLACSNEATSPSNNQTESSPSSPEDVPENIVKNYSVKADETEANIEAKMQEYFNEYGYYSIFLEDTK